MTIRLTKEDVYYAEIDGAPVYTFTYCATVSELPERVAALLGMRGYQGAVKVTWLGDDEQGRRAAERLNRKTAPD